jgi:hypothetical protein
METRLNSKWSQSSIEPITGVFPFDFSIPSATLDLSGLLKASLTNAHVVYKPFSWLPYGRDTGATVHIESLEGPILLHDVTVYADGDEYTIYGETPTPYKAFFGADGSNVTVDDVLIFESVTEGNHTHIETNYVSLDVERSGDDSDDDSNDILIITNVVINKQRVLNKFFMDKQTILVDDYVRFNYDRKSQLWIGQVFGEELLVGMDPFHVETRFSAPEHNVTLLKPFREIYTTHDGMNIDVGLYPITIKPPTIQHGPVSLTFDSSGLKVHTKGGELAGFKCIEVDAEINNTEYAVIHSFRASREDGQVVSGRGTFIFAEKKLELSADINF